jgi:regulator of nucleoside diphosphate kinase
MRRFLLACEQRLAMDQEHILALRARLAAALTIAPEDVPSTVATMHAQVRLRDVESGRTHVRTVVLPGDAEIATGRRPVCAWPGSVLLGAREGDEVRWRCGAGWRRFRVEKILYQPEAVERQLRAHVRRSRRGGPLRSVRADSLAKGLMRSSRRGEPNGNVAGHRE